LIAVGPPCVESQVGGSKFLFEALATECAADLEAQAFARLEWDNDLEAGFNSCTTVESRGGAERFV